MRVVVAARWQSARLFGLLPIATSTRVDGKGCCISTVKLPCFDDGMIDNSLQEGIHASYDWNAFQIQCRRMFRARRLMFASTAFQHHGVVATRRTLCSRHRRPGRRSDQRHRFLRPVAVLLVLSVLYIVVSLWRQS